MKQWERVSHCVVNLYYKIWLTANVNHYTPLVQVGKRCQISKQLYINYILHNAIIQTMYIILITILRIENKIRPCFWCEVFSANSHILIYY